MEYNYYRAVYDDVLQYVNDEIDYNDFETLEDLKEYLNTMLWDDDSVTGNASGSYTCNAWYAEEYLCHNLGLLDEALSEFGCDQSYLLTNGAEASDVTIRCYLLPRVISDVLYDIEEDFDDAHGLDDEEESENE